MKKFLRQLKSLKPEVSRSLQERILRDARILPKSNTPSFRCAPFRLLLAYRSFFVGTCVGLLLGMFLFSPVETLPVVDETPPPVEVMLVKPSEPLELDRLIAQLDKRNRAWEKTTIPVYAAKTWNHRMSLEQFTPF